MAVAVGCALLVAGLGQGKQEASGLMPVRLPLVACPTSVAVATPPSSVPLPASVAVTIPRSLVNDLAAYTDRSHLMVLLAPKGWACVATYGADGSGGIVVHPGSESAPTSSWGAGWHLPRGSHNEGVTATQTGGSSAQAAAQACSLFPNAASTFRAAFGRSCPEGSTHQTSYRQSRTIISFYDPPGVQGIGIPSGGAYPANGLLTYAAPSVPGSYLATCTLPTASGTLCRSVLGAFVRVYGTK
jgi:hypothetical protein